MNTSNSLQNIVLEEVSTDGRNECLLVSFGGVMVGITEARFEFKETTKLLTCDKIFISDVHQAWYQKGISPKIDSIEGILDYLTQVLERHPYKKVCFIGNSMGGYAAILFGALLGVDTVYAFSAQTFIDEPNRTLHKDTRWKSLMTKIHSETSSTYYDLYPILKGIFNKTPPEINIYLYYGQDKLDTLHAKRLQEFPQVHLIEFPDPGHNIVKKMRDLGILKTLLSNIFERKD